MSDISEQVEATIILADFVNIDGIGKANVIGAGIRIMPIDPQTGMTNPFGIIVFLSSALSGDSPAFELLLTTANGDVVTLPTPAGDQAIRISQNVEFSEPRANGPQAVFIPKGALPSNVQFAINFGSGLPVLPGNSYQFRAQIDHETVATYSFFVPKEQHPVVG